MTDSVAEQTTTPDIARPDARAVFVSHWYVGDPDRARSVLDEVTDAWRRAPWPEEVLTFSCYLSVEGDTVMTYTQCSGATTYRRFVGALPVAVARREPVEYRLHRSVVTELAAEPPGALVTAMFDVDGPERQRFIVDSIARRLEEAPADEHAGMIGSHFHLSVDGTRVTNFAEWTTDEAHVAFLEGGTRHGNLRVTEQTPGVRPIGFRRYHLHRSLGS
ncbi:antibiotic biosynthesis monooxygenase [Streptomyces tailanensis]|uniref:antibiotic biosynthesis monooxygenase n=1 Tax=Streptomyces tailanensis TaxID=2569858 RepID=UPI00122E6F1B|nr:antibiotic biosynthesis monooxygenase [Streptomyces tailanensis]